MEAYEEQGDAWLNGCAFLFAEKEFNEKSLMLELLNPQQIQIKTGNVITKSPKFEPPKQFPYGTNYNNRRINKGS